MLTPNEQSIFEACIQNPPYYEGGSEYGLAGAYEAVTEALSQKESLRFEGNLHLDPPVALHEMLLGGLARRPGNG